MLNLHLWRQAINPRNPRPQNPAGPVAESTGMKLNLSHVKPGQRVIISGYERLAPAHRQHLQAYGLVPGRAITVLAQQPVTIVLVEQTELAFETEIARQVVVE